MTATPLRMNNPSAAKRLNKPSTSKTGNPNCAPVPSQAAISGGSNGTWYSSLNKYKVLVPGFYFGQVGFDEYAGDEKA